MRLVVLACMLAACSRSFDFDVWVTKTAVLVRTGNQDLDCDCEGNEFPTVGYCFTTWTDFARPRCKRSDCWSCLDTLALELDGKRIATGSIETAAIPMADPTQPGLVLLIAGCGQPVVRIPLDVEPFATPTLTSQLSGSVAVEQWTTDVPAVASWFSYGTLYSGYDCLVEGQKSFSFGPTSAADAGFAVQTFGAIRTYKTALGTARVWSGGVADSTF